MDISYLPIPEIDEDYSHLDNSLYYEDTPTSDVEVECDLF